MKLRNKFAMQLFTIAMWQPRPHIGFTKDDEPISRWFNKPAFKGAECLTKRNWIGIVWDYIFWKSGKLLWKN